MPRFTAPLSILFASALLAACNSSTTDSNTSASADVYVAVGNSLTSGFQSGGLRADWQKASYPVLIANQMGIADFQIPTIDSPGVGTTILPGGLKAEPLYLDPVEGITTKALTVDVSTLLSNSSLNRPYNNLAVPGATTLDFTQAYDSNTSQQPGNGYFNIVLRGGLFQNASMMRQAIKLKPTIMTMWLGANDILGGITAGTVIEGVTVTPVAIYKVLMDKALDTLMLETTAHIFIANIPSITSIPYVVTVPTFVFKPDFTPAVSDSTKLVTAESDVQYVLLPALKAIKNGIGIPTALGGTGTPLGAGLTLTTAEVTTANALTDGYNAYLAEKTAANPDRLTLVDINGLLKKLTAGEISGLSAKFALVDSAHTAFSLDGIHPNSKGYKVVANVYIDAINAALGRKIASVP